MTIFVDGLQRARVPGCAAFYWCHLMTDGSDEELHIFAASIGLRREWFQGDHYDLARGKRREAIELGAVVVTSRELGRLRLCKRLRLPYKS